MKIQRLWHPSASLFFLTSILSRWERRPRGRGTVNGHDQSQANWFGSWQKKRGLGAPRARGEVRIALDRPTARGMARPTRSRGL